MSVPVIASGGAGCIDDFIKLFHALPKVHAVLAASIFHFGEVKISDLKAEMKKNGIEFGSHTLSHVELTKVSPADAKKQLSDSSLALAYHTGTAPIALAYPCGRFNDEVLQIVKDTGYRLGFTVELGFDRKNDNPLMLRRIPIFGCISHIQDHFETRLKYPLLCERLERLSAYLSHSSFPWLANFVPLI